MFKNAINRIISSSPPLLKAPMTTTQKKLENVYYMYNKNYETQLYNYITNILISVFDNNKKIDYIKIYKNYKEIILEYLKKSPVFDLYSNGEQSQFKIDKELNIIIEKYSNILNSRISKINNKIQENSQNIFIYFDLYNDKIEYEYIKSKKELTKENIYHI